MLLFFKNLSEPLQPLWLTVTPPSCQSPLCFLLSDSTSCATLRMKSPRPCPAWPLQVGWSSPLLPSTALCCPLLLWSCMQHSAPLTVPLLLPCRRRQVRVGRGAGVSAEGIGTRLSRGSDRWSAALRASPAAGQPPQLHSEQLRLVQL